MNAYYFQWNESMVGERLKCLRMGTADWYPFTGYEKSGEGGVFPAIFSITLVKQLVTALYWQFKKILERFKFAKKYPMIAPPPPPPPPPLWFYIHYSAFFANPTIHMAIQPYCMATLTLLYMLAFILTLLFAWWYWHFVPFLVASTIFFIYTVIYSAKTNKRLLLYINTNQHLGNVRTMDRTATHDGVCCTVLYCMYCPPELDFITA